MKIDVKNLPESKEELQKMIFALHESLHKKENELSGYKIKYEHLLEEIRLSKQKRFSSSSEKNIFQQDLFDESGVELPKEVLEILQEETASIASYVRKKHPVRKPLPAYLPRE